MPVVMVCLPGPLRRFVDGAREVPAAGLDVAGVLRSLAKSHSRLTDRILDSGGQPRPFLRLYLNDADISSLQQLQTTVAEGDRLAILLAIAGG